MNNAKVETVKAGETTRWMRTVVLTDGNEIFATRDIPCDDFQAQFDALQKTAKDATDGNCYWQSM